MKFNRRIIKQVYDSVYSKYYPKYENINLYELIEIVVKRYLKIMDKEEKEIEN